MKKALLAILLLFIQCTNSKQIFNGDFEDIDSHSGRPSGWIFKFNSEQENAYRIKLDSINKYEGKFSLSIEKFADDTEFGLIKYPINKIFDGNEITLKGYIKTKNVKTGYAGLWMRLDESPGKVFAIDNSEGKGVKGDNPWKSVSITLPK